MTLDPAALKSRLMLRLSLIELAALTSAVLFGAGFIHIWSHYPNTGILFDFLNYAKGARGDMSSYYYAPWGIPFIFPFACLPVSIGAFAWQLFNIGGMFYAARIFGGKSAALILSFQMYGILYYGQISGILCLGIALMWLGLSKRSWLLAGLGMIIAAIKPQVAPVVGLFWLFAYFFDTDHPAAHRRICRMALIVPLLVVMGSFLIQPDWLSQMIAHVNAIPPDDNASITIWKYIGAWGLLLFIPPVVLPLNPRSRLLALLSAWLISAPYCQSWDISALLMLLPNWLALLTWSVAPFGIPHPAVSLIFQVFLSAIYLREISPGVFRILGLDPARISGFWKIKFAKTKPLEHDQQDKKRIID